MKTCPECKSECPDDAHVCRHCRHNFTINPLKILTAIILLVIAVSLARTFG
jgi:hypothetical protein